MRQDFGTAPAAPLQVHHLPEGIEHSQELTSSCAHRQVVGYQVPGPNGHKRLVRALEVVGEAPGRSLSAAIRRRTPHFRDQMVVAVRAPVGEVDGLIALGVPHAVRIDGVLGLVEVLQALRADADLTCEVEKLIQTVLSHLDIYDSNCPLQLDRMAQSSRGCQQLTSATVNEHRFRSSLPRQCRILMSRSESGPSCGQSRYDRQ